MRKANFMNRQIFFIGCVVCLLACASIQAQTIYSCEYKSEAEIKVFVADYKSEADLVVYKCKYKSEASGNEGLWFFVEYKSEAKKKIYFVKYKSEADVILFFSDYKSDAGWRNASKKHLMY